MNLSAEYLKFSKQLTTQYQIPEVVSILLPPMVNEPKKKDEFGFLILADGTAAPFYTSLDDTLSRLWQSFPPDSFKPTPISALLEWFTENQLELRAMAFGAYNAMSQHLLARSRVFDEIKRSSITTYDIMQSKGQLGMVGYFRPLIDRLLNQGQSVIVVEKNPDRVEPKEGLTLASSPEVLNQCDDIICTASTLINDTLDDILRHKRADAYLALIGPSASGLPDVLFRNGIDEIGGIRITNQTRLRSAFSLQTSWGDAGEKYQLFKTSYPGIGQLVRNTPP